jgi:hypothetical protein
MKLGRYLAALIIVISAAISSTVRAQDTTAPSLFFCGSSFAIGMNTSAALSQVRDDGRCIVNELKGKSSDSELNYLLQSKQNPQTLYAELITEGGRVIKIWKYWDVNVQNQDDYAQALIGLLNNFETEGRTHCIITSGSKFDPELNGKDAVITCGRKSIRLGLTEYKGSKNISIVETLE